MNSVCANSTFWAMWSKLRGAEVMQAHSHGHVEGQPAEEAYPGLLPLCVQAEVKVPQPPVAHAGPQLQGRPQKNFEQRPLHNSPLLQLCLASWVPCCVFHQPA